MFVIAPQTVSVQTCERESYNGINRKLYNPICIILKHGQYAVVACYYLGSNCFKLQVPILANYSFTKSLKTWNDGYKI
jgi:hypothetical protein